MSKNSLEKKIPIIMKAAVLEGVKNLVVKEIPTPIAANDMAFVKVKVGFYLQKKRI